MYIFAFDDIADRDLIEDRLAMIRESCPDNRRHFKFYVLCGYDRTGKWDRDFWESDIRDAFERIRILVSYGASPYLMRHERCYSSEYAGVYSCMAGWCNQPGVFRKFTFAEYCRCKGMGDKRYPIYRRDFGRYLADGNPKGAAWRYLEAFQAVRPDIAAAYFDMPTDARMREAS